MWNIFDLSLALPYEGREAEYIFYLEGLFDRYQPSVK